MQDAVKRIQVRMYTDVHCLDGKPAIWIHTHYPDTQPSSENPAQDRSDFLQKPAVPL